MKITTTPEADAVFAAYPDFVRDKMQRLRELVIETAEETPGVSELQVCLKWGEPAFITKNGSTIRMDWKEKAPNQYALYFKCTSRLVDTFRLVFDNEFQFEGKRAIVFKLNQRIPVEELKKCIRSALVYHKVKHLETLGIHN